MPLSMNKALNYQFPPGFRFHPSDEELIVHYLQNKVTSRPIPASIIAEVDLYKCNPWELPKKALFGEDEWFFFSPRYRKYPNGARPNRSAGSGYWKATGIDKPIFTSSGSKCIGVKKALVFYKGRPPKGLKTEWIMNEYRLLDTTIKPSRSKGSMRLDDWVLCRVRQKGMMSKNTCEVQDSPPNKESIRSSPKIEEARPTNANYNTDDMITDCLNKDCRLLASILAGQTALPSIETISCSSFQGSNTGNSGTSVYEEGTDNMNSPVTISSLNHNNPLKRKIDEEDRFDNLLPSGKKLNSNDRNGDLLPSETESENNINIYIQNLSQEIFYNPNLSDSIIGSLELNELNFTGDYI